MKPAQPRRALGINTYSYIWSTPALECLQQLGAHGYAEFELVVNPPHLALEIARDDRQRLARLAAEGLRIRCLNLPSLDTNLGSSMARMREYSVGVFRDAIDLASELGAEYVITVPGRVSPLLAPEPALRQEWMGDSLERLLPHAVARGVKLAVENVPMACFPDAASLGAFVRGFASPHVRVCYDAANAHFIGESPAEGLRQLADLVSVVHLSDTTRRAWRHDEVGLGDVPFAETLAAMDAIGFGGPCMMEIIHPDPLSGILRSHQGLTELGWAPLKEAAA